MSRPSRRTLLLAGSGVAAALLVGAAASVAADDAVPRGVRVLGVELGGLSRAAAVERLTAGIADATAEPVVLRAGDEEISIPTRAAGLAVDVEATVDEALSAGPVDRLRALVGAERDLAPQRDVDDDLLEGELRKAAEVFDRPVREGAVAFTEAGVPEAVQPLEGRRLDVEGAADAVRDDWLREPVVDVPVEVEDVETTDEDVAQALEEVARPAVSAPVSLQVDDKVLELLPADVARALTFEVEDGELVPRFDGQALLESVGERRLTVEQPARDASFRVEGGVPSVVPSQDGRTLDPAAVAAAVQPVLTAPAPRTARVALVVTPASLTTEAAQALGIKEQISSYTSKFPCCRPRVKNIQRIAELVDGHVVKPGERFDLNEVVGPRDRARGFVEAPQILEGEFVDSVGGGVSQFATAVFNAYFFAGLKDIEHKPHSYWIRRYPPGREATVSFPEPDLIFENDSPHGVLITTSSTGTSVTVTMYGTKRFDVEAVQGPMTRFRDFETRYVQRDDCLATEGERGFDIVVTRVFKQGGRVVKREDFKTRYLPEPNFVCGPPPRRSPAPSPSPSSAPPAPVPPPTEPTPEPTP